MKLYSESTMSRVIENNKVHPIKNITDFNKAINSTEVSDYKEVTYDTYCDWKLLIEMNDKKGPYNNMLTYNKRKEIIDSIHNWERDNFR